MSNNADKLRAKARQTRFLARQAFSRSRAEALHSLATVYESQAVELDCSGFPVPCFEASLRADA